MIAIAAGLFHSLALSQDGLVAAWGGNESGQSTAPTGLSGVIGMAVGDEHALVLNQNGTVVA